MYCTKITEVHLSAFVYRLFTDEWRDNFMEPSVNKCRLQRPRFNPQVRHTGSSDSCLKWRSLVPGATQPRKSRKASGLQHDVKKIEKNRLRVEWEHKTSNRDHEMLSLCTTLMNEETGIKHGEHERNH